MIRLLTLSISVSVSLLAACAPGGTPVARQDAAASANATADPAAGALAGAAGASLESVPPEWSQDSENSIISIRIDPAIGAFDPAIASGLWTKARAELNEFARQADEDRAAADAEAQAGGGSWFVPYTMNQQYRVTAQAGDVISIESSIDWYTGGAHPNYGLGGLVHRRGMKDPIQIDALVTDRAAFGEGVIERLADEKERRGTAEMDRADVILELHEMLTRDTPTPYGFTENFTLVPSTESGKFGGISVLFSPYQVGAYAEGSYIATLSASELRPMLKAEWAPLFGGEPVLPASE